MSYRRTKKKRKGQGLVWVFAVVALLAGFLIYQTAVLKKKQADYAARESELESQIAEESRRAEDLEEYDIFTRTLKYIEQIAREKLGLGYPGEVVVEPEK